MYAPTGSPVDGSIPWAGKPGIGVGCRGIAVYFRPDSLEVKEALTLLIIFRTEFSARVR